MKKLYTLLVVAISAFSYGQTIFSENMGVPNPSPYVTPDVYSLQTAPATFQNGAPIVFSGNGDMRATAVSTTYAGASGGGNAYLAGTAGKYFQIDGINTAAYNTANIKMNFGYLTAAVTTQVVLEYSTNATAATPTWTPITFVNNSTTSWALVSIPGGILPASANLSIRFSQPAVLAQIRIDDIKIFNFNPACTLVLGTPAAACDATTAAIDTYTATVSYTGGGTTGHTITTTPAIGTIGGANPNTTTAGDIVISGIPEGTSIVVNVVKGVCTYDVAVTAPECKIVNALPFYESFPYAAGSSLGASQQWTNYNGGDNIVATAGSLNYTGILSSGNSETFSGAGIDCFTPFTDTTSGTVYAAFLVNVTDMANLTNATATTFFAGLQDAAKTYRARVHLVKNGTQYQIGLSTGAPTATTFDATLRNVGDTLLIILACDITANSVKLYVNPTVASFALATPTVTETPTTALVSLGGFTFRQDGANTTPTMTVDELKIATDPIQLLASNTFDPISGLKVYPNPVTNGMFYVETDNNSSKNITIFDILGKQVLNTVASNSAINVANLNSGVYMVKITEEGKTATRKLVIQ